MRGILSVCLIALAMFGFAAAEEGHMERYEKLVASHHCHTGYTGKSSPTVQAKIDGCKTKSGSFQCIFACVINEAELQTGGDTMNEPNAGANIRAYFDKDGQETAEKWVAATKKCAEEFKRHGKTIPTAYKDGMCAIAESLIDCITESRQCPPK